MPTGRSIDNWSVRQSELVALAAMPLGGGAAQQLADSFGSFAASVQTRFETSGGPTGGGLRAEVERALGVVLNRPGVPARNGVVTIPTVLGAAPSVSPSGAGTGISAEQAALVTQVRATVDATLPLLASLDPQSPAIDPVQASMMRGIIEVELRMLMAEIGRVDEPRVDRVRLLLQALRGWNQLNGDIAQLAVLVQIPAVGGGGFPTLAKENQLAALNALTDASIDLDILWTSYLVALGITDPVVGLRPSGVPGPTPLPYTERLRRAFLQLPVLRDSRQLAEGALAALGFTAADQRAERMSSISLIDANVGVAQRQINTTIADVFDWVDELTGGASDQLDRLGLLGLTLLADQADAVFWIIDGMLLHTNPGQLPEELGDVQVRRFLTALARQLSALADLAA